MTRAAPPHEGPRRLALVIEYDGGRYGGSQFQKNAPSIQKELESALRQLTGEQVRVDFAGRTDAGVHAAGQVAALTTNSTFDTSIFVSGLNAHLPQDIAVRVARFVKDRFNPRREAESRTYRYTIYNRPIRSPLWRKQAWRFPEPLDAARMQKAADVLVGTHDFASFSRREGVSTVRTVSRCAVRRAGPLVTVEIEATVFLRQQVRRTIGVLAQAGSKRMTLADVRALLKRAEPCTAEPVAPPQGLCLMHVTYPGLDLSLPDTL